MFLLDETPEQWDLGSAPAYRRDQVRTWVFEHRVAGFSDMSNLPQDLRQDLAQRYTLVPLQLAKIQGSHDTTRKLLWQLEAGDYIESVLIPASPDLFGERADRFTLCLSTQVGCAYGCKFCASGLEGWKRNLTPAEIVSQIIETERHTKTKINNLVFMGMGEPLANYSNLMQAITLINAPWGLNLGARHITISTSGLAPQIRQLADEPRQIRLALSLHGATDEVRQQIMPVNRKYPLAVLLEACAYYQQKKRKMMTLEYILIADVNDSLEQAQILAGHARRLHAKVNLIPYNTVEGLAWKRPQDAQIDLFAETLKDRGVTATVRREKGHDIDAACGQLRLQELKAQAQPNPQP
jgi:23S rRNA (adenine2503-C2)-methyltransferase